MAAGRLTPTSQSLQTGFVRPGLQGPVPHPGRMVRPSPAFGASPDLNDRRARIAGYNAPDPEDPS